MADAASRSKSLLKFFVMHLAKALGYGLPLGIIVALAGLVWYMESRPDLSVWQTADLDLEFTADSGIDDLEDYLGLESRLFEQLGLWSRTGSDTASLLFERPRVYPGVLKRRHVLAPFPGLRRGPRCQAG